MSRKGEGDKRARPVDVVLFVFVLVVAATLILAIFTV
jgi:hypothetical protein